MNASALAAAKDSVPGFPGVSFGRSADGLLVALVGETAFAMAPARDGRNYLVSGWRIARPMEQWSRSDFYGHSGELADEAAFRHRVLENAEHQREKRALGRREICSRASTPWGASQGATLYAEDVVFHSTAGHGGFHISAERNRKVHPLLRAEGGWYEEDESWAAVAITFPHLFTAFERRCAERTTKDSWPDAWEAIFGTVLQPGESREKDRRAFEHAHAADWIVISAITSDQQPGFVEVVATPGGKRGPQTEERRFLVPSAEYRIGCFGFVIDPARHRVYGGPSSFIRWSGKAGTLTARGDRLAELSRMQEARRQTQRQLDRINRQITRRMTAFIPQLKQRHAFHRRGKAPAPSAFLERYRAHLAAVTAERQPEIDALSRKLARQDAAIEAFCQRHGLALGGEARAGGGSGDHRDIGQGACDHRECGHG